MHYDQKEVDRLSGTTEAQRATLFRWLAKQGEQTRIEAAKLQTDLIRQNRQQSDKSKHPEFVFAMHILALVKMHWIETAQSQKVQMSESEAAKLTGIRIERIKAQRRKKSSPKKEAIRIRFYHEIKMLRENGLSWRQVSDYIAKNHKTRIGFSYLRETFAELTEEKEKAGA